MIIDIENFQTPPVVCEYMANMLPDRCGIILEPTPGKGNLVEALKKKGDIVAPNLFEHIPPDARYDWVVMNPPFTPIQEGFEYLKKVCSMSDNIIALLPWLLIINSEKRLKFLQDYGLVSITSLPRKTFPKCRIQTCIVLLKKDFKGVAEFKTFNW